MAITYGGTVHHWCAGIEASVANTSNTVCTVTVNVYWHSYAWGYNYYGNGYGVIGANTNTATSTTFKSGTGATVDQLIQTYSTTYTRGTSAQTVTCKAVVALTGDSTGTRNGTSTATVNVSIPAKPSYTVTYNANGGSGAPSAQTKWYGTSLTLSSTKPTRSQYNFLRWNTKSDGTGTSYQPSASYTTDAALALYAIWELAYAYPTITNANVIRTDSSNVAQDDGTYAYLTFSWAVDGTADAGTNTVEDIFWSVKESTTGAYPADTPVTASGISGTVGVSIGSGFDVDKTYDVRVSVVDKHGGVYTKYLVLTQAFFTLDFGRSGHSIGIGTTASETADGIDVAAAMPITLGGRSVMYIEGAKGDVAVYAPKLATGSNQWNPILGIQTKGGGVWTLGNYDGESFKFCYHSQSTITAGTNAPDRQIQFNADGTASGFVVSDMLPTVLYNNTTGTNGNVTLSQSAANFTRLRIFANLQNAGYCSCEVWSPNGKSFSVTGMALPQSTTIQQAWWSGSISGTTITKKSSGYMNTTTHSSGNHTGAAATSTDMKIVRVEGYKW